MKRTIILAFLITSIMTANAQVLSFKINSNIDRLHIPSNTLIANSLKSSVNNIEINYQFKKSDELSFSVGLGYKHFTFWPSFLNESSEQIKTGLIVDNAMYLPLRVKYSIPIKGIKHFGLCFSSGFSPAYSFVSKLSNKSSTSYIESVKYQSVINYDDNRFNLLLQSSIGATYSLGNYLFEIGVEISNGVFDQYTIQTLATSVDFPTQEIYSTSSHDFYGCYFSVGYNF